MNRITLAKCSKRCTKCRRKNTVRRFWASRKSREENPMKQIQSRIAGMLVALMAAGLFAACEGQDPVAPKEKAIPPETEQNEPVKIGFSMDTLKEERWLKDRDLFRQAAEELGAEVEIAAASGDDALQIAQAETMIQAGIDVLVIVPHNAEATAAIVHKAHQAGIKVIAYDRLVKNADVDLYVSF